MPTMQCSVCGAQVHVELWRDDPAREAPDLDTRPGAPARATVGHWVQECPECGYSAPDLTYAAGDAKPVVHTPDYRACANRFLKHALILERLGHLADAGWVALHGAWWSDDQGDLPGATLCRRRAVELWKQAKAAGMDFMDSPVEEFAVVTDVLRRAGEWQEATETCAAALDEELPEMFDVIIRFQKGLIMRRDAARHTMDELPKPPRGGSRVTLS